MTIFICQFCGRETTNAGANKAHENKCKNNPNPATYKVGGKTQAKGSNQYTKAKKLGLPLPKYDRSHLPLSGCAIASTEQRSKWAKEAGTGGYKPNAGRSKKFRVKDSYGNEVVLQSSYELKCSELLNELNINWIRPKHLKYEDKKYFADFYLPEYNIYLDPKNNYKAKLDKEKIKKVKQSNNVKIFILTYEMLTTEYIKELVSPNGEGLA